MPGLAVSLKRFLALCALFGAVWIFYRSSGGAGPAAGRRYPDRHAYYASLYGGRKDLQPVVVYRQGFRRTFPDGCRDLPYVCRVATKKNRSQNVHLYRPRILPQQN